MKFALLKLFLLLGGPVFIVVKSASAQTSQPLPEFTRIRIVDNVQVELVIADRHSIYIDGNNQNQAAVSVNNGVLSLDASNANGKTIKVFTKNIQQITLDGIARIESLDTIKTANLTIQADGASKAKLLISCNTFKANIDGGSELIIAGTTQQASVNADGSSNLKGAGLKVSEATVKTDGAAQVRLNISETLNANADGSSKIIFSGNPQNRIFSVDGGAKIENADVKEEISKTTTTEEEKEVITDGDTTRVKIGKRRLMIIEDKDNEETYGSGNEEIRRREMKSVWEGFELGVQGFATPQFNFNMPASYDFLNSNIGKSWFFGLNFPELDGQIIQNKLAITTGLGLLWSNIRFDGNAFLTPNMDSLSATPPAPGVNLSKNKLHTFDITAPLLIKWAPGTPRKAKGGFHFAAGAIFHYVAIKRVVTESSSLGFDQRVKLNDDFNINSFRMDATVRVGFHRVRLFANYSLTPYFNQSKAPDVRLFSAGLTLIGF